jgi:ribulose-phosphate 3-epimerase
MCADLLKLGKVINDFDKHCDGFHIDVMDDHFVPNLTMGPDFVNAIAKATRKPVQVHLMVDNPRAWVDRLNLGKKDTFIFHYEAFECFKPMKDLIDLVKAKGWKVGVAFNPDTEIDLVEKHLVILDKVLVMSVKPGFAGQMFIPSVLNKVKKLIKLKKTQKAKYEICMDGGIGTGNIKSLSDLGVNSVSVGGAIFYSKRPLAALKELYEIANRA